MLFDTLDGLISQSTPALMQKQVPGRPKKRLPHHVSAATAVAHSLTDSHAPPAIAFFSKSLSFTIQ
jgi:hypothetical protein